MDIFEYALNNSKRAKCIFPQAKKIIAVGDIHGDLDGLIRCLKKAKILGHGKWDWVAPPGTFVVQLGDVLDGKRPGINPTGFLKKPQEKAALAYLFQLDLIAQKHKGRVLSILGNHELSPIYFDSNQVKDYIKKVDFQSYEGNNRIEQFKPGKKYAKFLAWTKCLILKIGPVVFVHGGIDLNLLKNRNNITKINNQVFSWLYKGAKRPSFMNGTGELSINPCYNRRYSVEEYENNPSTCAQLIKVLKKLKATTMVVGHSVQHQGINSLSCTDTQGKQYSVWRVDTGISRAFGPDGSNLQVLEINKNGVSIIGRTSNKKY